MDVQSMLFVAAYALKPILYITVCVLVERRWRAVGERRWWRPIAAALVRLGLGVLIGVPLMIFLSQAFSDAVVIPVFSLFRFVLWLLTFAVFYRSKTRWREVLVICAVLALVSWGLDYLETGGEMFGDSIRNFRMC